MPAKKINPLSRKIQTSVRLPRYILQYMERHKANRADMIEAAMIAHYGLKKPNRSENT